MKKVFSILFVVFIANLTYAQEENAEGETYDFYFAAVPQYVIVNGLRLDFEKRFKESIHAVVVAPRVYLGEVDGNGGDFVTSAQLNTYTLSGFGVELMHKLYIEKSLTSDLNFYMAYSGMYQNFQFDYTNEDWVPFVNSQGETVLTLGEKDQTLKIDQFGFTTFLGALYKIDKRVYCDVYAGIGAKKSNAKDSSSSKAAEDEFSDSIIGYGFTGAILNVGLKVGVTF